MMEQITLLWCLVDTAVIGGLTIFGEGFLIGLACRFRPAPRDDHPPVTHRQPGGVGRGTIQSVLARPDRRGWRFGVACNDAGRDGGQHERTATQGALGPDTTWQSWRSIREDIRQRS
jgi:hypothetical protein